MAEVPLPDEIKQFPMFEGAIVQQSMNMGQGVFAILQLPKGASLETVVDFYKKYFKDAGWEADMEIRQDTIGTLSFSKGDERAMLNVDFTDSQGIYTVMHSNGQ